MIFWLTFTGYLLIHKHSKNPELNKKWICWTLQWQPPPLQAFLLPSIILLSHTRANSLPSPHAALRLKKQLSLEQWNSFVTSQLHDLHHGRFSFHHSNALFVCSVLGKQEALYHFLIAKKKWQLRKFSCFHLTAAWTGGIHRSDQLHASVPNSPTIKSQAGATNPLLSHSMYPFISLPGVTWWCFPLAPAAWTRGFYAVPQVPLLSPITTHPWGTPVPLPAHRSQQISSSEFQHCWDALANTTGCSARQKSSEARKRQRG